MLTSRFKTMPSEHAKTARNKPAQKATEAEWTIRRRYLLVRPLTSKLQSLEILLQRPSLATTILPEVPKRQKQSLDESDYGIKPQPRSGNAHGRSHFFGEGRPGDKIRRTYSANSTSEVVVSPIITSPKDQSHPKALLELIRTTVKPEVYQLYCGIYTSFKEILVTTKAVTAAQGLPPLKVIAARRVAQCIISSEEFGESGDIWYEHASEVGRDGEYCSNILRWEAIEQIRKTICSNLLPSQQRNGLGLPAVLVGLCRGLNANAEAESLLRTMMELFPLTEDPRNPALVTLFSFWTDKKDEMFRLLAETLVEEGRPTSLTNPSVNEGLKLAVQCLESSELAQKLITRALETAFGVWGERYIAAAAKQRQQSAKRKGARRSDKTEGRLRKELDDLRKSRDRQRPIPRHIVQRAENVALELTQKLVVAAHSSPNTAAMSILDNLTHGFLVQDEAMRTITEEEWKEWYPIAAKVVILLQSLGRDSEHDISITGELVRCLEEIWNEVGNVGLQSLGEFVAICYENLYTKTGRSITEKDEVKALVDRLISYASTGSFSIDSDNASTIDAQAPKTPRRHSSKIVTFTPGKVPADPQHERERYFITQLALHVASGFSKLRCAMDKAGWNQWWKKVEFKIMGMKVRTPAKPKAVGGDEEKTPKQRKGWRWEEGIDEWVEVGGTPGGPSKEKKVTQVIEAVEIPIRMDWEPTWRDDYKIFSDRSAKHGTTTTTTDKVSADGEYYAPTPARVPSSVHRSPRKTQRLKQSLRAFAVMLPSRRESSREASAHGESIGSSFPVASPAPTENLISSPLVASSGNIRRKRKSEDSTYEESEDEINDPTGIHSLSSREASVAKKVGKKSVLSRPADKKQKMENELPQQKLRKRPALSVEDDDEPPRQRLEKGKRPAVSVGEGSDDEWHP
jgi:hypothetical protein